MIAAPLRLLKRLGAKIVGRVEAIKANPDFREVECDHVLHDRVVAVDRYGKSALEVFASFVEVSDLGVKDSEIIEDPRHRFRVPRHLEGAEAVGVKCGCLGEVAAHARENAAVLLNHSQKPRVSGFMGEFGRFGVESLGLFLITPSLRNRAQTVERVSLR